MGTRKVSNTGHVVRPSTTERLVADCNRVNNYLQDMQTRFTDSWPLEAVYAELGFSRTRAELIEAILRKVGVLVTKKNGSTKIKARSKSISPAEVKAALSPSKRVQFFGTDEPSSSVTQSEVASEKPESPLDQFRDGKDPFEDLRTSHIPVEERIDTANEAQATETVLSEELQRQLARHIKGLRAHIEKLEAEIAQKDAYIAELELKCTDRPTVDPELAEVLKELDM